MQWEFHEVGDKVAIFGNGNDLSLIHIFIASGAILHYLDITKHTQVEHINALTRIEEERFVRLDKFTVRSLELLAPMNEGGKSLLEVLDKTISVSYTHLDVYKRQPSFNQNHIHRQNSFWY